MSDADRIRLRITIRSTSSREKNSFYNKRTNVSALNSTDFLVFFYKSVLSAFIIYLVIAFTHCVVIYVTVKLLS